LPYHTARQSNLIRTIDNFQKSNIIYFVFGGLLILKIFRLSIGSPLNPGGADLTRETKKASH
jgi:hypothetical protein